MDCSQVVYLWIIVMFLNLFELDGTHSPQKIHWWVSYVILNYMKK